MHFHRPASGRPAVLRWRARSVGPSPYRRTARTSYRSTADTSAAAARRRFAGLDQLMARPMRGSRRPVRPFISPDSRWIRFFEQGRLLERTGERRPSHHYLPRQRRNARIVRGGPERHDRLRNERPGDRTLQRLGRRDGEPKVLNKAPHVARRAGSFFPLLLPGGRAVLFTIAASPVGEFANRGARSRRRASRRH